MSAELIDSSVLVSLFDETDPGKHEKEANGNMEFVRGAGETASGERRG